MSFCNILDNVARQIRAILYHNASKRLIIYAQALASGIGLILGRTILCKLTPNPITMHYTKDKLGCCIISYRNITRLFYRKFIGNFSGNFKLSLNRGTPTLLLNLYLTNPNNIFALFGYFRCHKKLNREGEMTKQTTKRLRQLKREFTNEEQRLTEIGFLNPASKAREPKLKVYQILLAEGYSVEQTVNIFKEL